MRLSLDDESGVAEFATRIVHGDEDGGVFDEESFRRGRSPRNTTNARKLVSGRLHGRKVILAATGIGKTCATMLTTLFVEKFPTREVLMTGVTSRRVGGVARRNGAVLGDRSGAKRSAAEGFARLVSPGAGHRRCVARNDGGAILGLPSDRDSARAGQLVGVAPMHRVGGGGGG